jgi:hypothetical protein
MAVILMRSSLRAYSWQVDILGNPFGNHEEDKTGGEILKETKEW